MVSPSLEPHRALADRATCEKAAHECAHSCARARQLQRFHARPQGSPAPDDNPRAAAAAVWCAGAVVDRQRDGLRPRWRHPVIPRALAALREAAAAAAVVVPCQRSAMCSGGGGGGTLAGRLLQSLRRRNARGLLRRAAPLKAKIVAERRRGAAATFILPAHERITAHAVGQATRKQLRKQLHDWLGRCHGRASKRNRGRLRAPC